MNNNCIILTGGGTAGHVTLNINLQNDLKKHFNKIVYIGSKSGIEKTLIKSNTTFIYEEITTTKLTRRKILKNLSIPFKLLKAIKEAKQIIKKYKPKIIFSKGGYVGLPVVIAGKKSGIPVVCHESDISMGLANKLAKRYATKICTNFELTAKENGDKCVYTGMPLALSPLSKQEAKQKLNINTNKPVLLITGGSMGAKALNEFIFSCAEKLTKNYYIIHLVGKNNLNKNLNIEDYKQIEFTNDMWTILKATDYAISRAGANTIIELFANKILTIFVPLPKKASRGDQLDNASYFENMGLSKTILQEDLTLQKVQNSLKFLEINSDLIKNKIKNAKFTDGRNNIINIILQEKNTWKPCVFYF